MFKKIQEAYEFLSDPKKKIQFDSQEPFDNSVPSASDLDDNLTNFFEVFEPVFERNAKWSVSRKIPTLGNLDTEWSHVEKFYDFWFHFKTWKDFSYLDEYDPEEASCREERRWIDRRNNKIRNKNLVAERARIRGLVETCYKYDPRVKAKKNEEKLVREQKRQARIDRAIKKKEKEEKRLNEARLQKEEEERVNREKIEQERKHIKKQKKALQRRKNRLRSFGENYKFSVEKINYMCNFYNLEEFNELFEKMEGKNKREIFAILNQSHDSLKLVIENREKIDQEHKRRKNREEFNWTEEEEVLLSKAIARYPEATRGRWKKIQSFIGGNKSVELIIARVKYQTKTSGSRRTLAEQYQEHSNASTDVQTTEESTSTPIDDWTPTEQKSLELALKKFPSSLGKERWKSISKAVPGRSRRECIQRYKHILSIIQNNRS
eukprot:TRINITY_DN6786_c0_g1_i1.p1 TRINITY_DN6786_c0_g1~~TRINITY_DN6786_c0_g1_i1.p1  ORF type:complete len:435 (-),score=106.30 TRINITY_DN6786_c0_g1_i1:35-1339(-)